VLTVESTMGALDSAFGALGAAGAAGAGAGAGRAGEDRPPGGGHRRAADGGDGALGLRRPHHGDARELVHDRARPSAGSGDAGVSSIAIWDCGELGYWQRELPAEPIKEGQISPDSPLRLVQVPAKRVWKLIGDLLPNRDEIREETA
jgi:hypothetical protein